MPTPTQPAGAPGPTTDQELERVRRAFGSAFRRMCAASMVADLENELSNMLHQLHRLGELSRWRLGPTGTKLSPQAFGAVLAGSDDLRAARAAMWARRFDTHDLVVVASPLAFPAITTPRCTAYSGLAAARIFAEQADPDGRHRDYADVLEGRAVLDMMRRAFDAMAGL